MQNSILSRNISLGLVRKLSLLVKPKWLDNCDLDLSAKTPWGVFASSMFLSFCLSALWKWDSRPFSHLFLCDWAAEISWCLSLSVITILSGNAGNLTWNGYHLFSSIKNNVDVQLYNCKQNNETACHSTFCTVFFSFLWNYV